MGEKEGDREHLGRGQKWGDTHPRLHGLGHSLHALNGPLEQGTNHLAALLQGFQTL